MKVDTLIKMITILPKTREGAINSTTIRDEFYSYVMTKDSLTDGSKNKHIRQQITDLFDLGILGIVPYNPPNKPVVKGKADKSARYEKYYLLQTELLKYFMDSKVALNVILSKNVMGTLGDVYDAKNVLSTAENVPKNQRDLALLSRIRIVPDGIARDYADVKPHVLAPILSAIEHGHRVALAYRTSQGQLVDDGPDSEGRAVLGLVAKDGTLYLINCKGFSDTPTHIPLHRVTSAIEIGHRTFERTDIVLDDYLSKQHQLAHVKQGEDSPIHMVLKVSKEAKFHFDERPICGVDGSVQVISEDVDQDGRYTLDVTVPYTVQLPPFLWSHAGWVEVISPPNLRKFVGEHLLAAAEQYR